MAELTSNIYSQLTKGFWAQNRRKKSKRQRNPHLGLCVLHAKRAIQTPFRLFVCINRAKNAEWNERQRQNEQKKLYWIIIWSNNFFHSLIAHFDLVQNQYSRHLLSEWRFFEHFVAELIIYMSSNIVNKVYVEDTLMQLNWLTARTNERTNARTNDEQCSGQLAKQLPPHIVVINSYSLNIPVKGNFYCLLNCFFFVLVRGIYFSILAKRERILGIFGVDGVKFRATRGDVVDYMMADNTPS